MGDVYVVQACVVLALIPWFIYVLGPLPSLQRRFLIIFFAGVLLGVAGWIRSQASTPVLVFFLILMLAAPLQRKTKLMLSLALLAGMSMPAFYSRLLMHERDIFLAARMRGYQPPINGHLLWHTTYLGLSYLNNPYVPAWKDVVAVQYVQSVDPAAIYGSSEYETLLRHRVEKIARLDPRFIFYTVAAKVGVLACMILLSANFGLLAAICRPKPPSLELAFWLAMGCAAMPGLVAIPLPQYVIGMVMLAFYYWYYSVSFYTTTLGEPDAYSGSTKIPSQEPLIQ
jgi:hypothetical protein